MSDITDYLDSLRKVLSELPEKTIRDHVEVLRSAQAEGKQVFLIGNGGSAATASHIACDLQKGVKERGGRRLKAIALTDNTAIMTAWGNDTSYDNVFLEQFDSLLEPGDVVIAISGSGNSPNIISAVEKANSMGALTIGWSGFVGGRLAQVARMSLVVNSDNMQRIEDVHLILGHLVFASLSSGGSR